MVLKKFGHVRCTFSKTFLTRVYFLFVFRSLLEALEAADNDPERISSCFLDKALEFGVYSVYCTSYHRYEPSNIPSYTNLHLADPGDFATRTRNTIGKPRQS